MLSIIRRVIYLLRYTLLYKIQFGFFDIKATIINPLSIDCPKNIFIGKAYVGKMTWLAAVPLTSEKECKLVIKDGCLIGHFNHIYATGKIVIENDVLTADKVYISDNLHRYDDIEKPIHKQPIKQNGHVTIGEGSWLGENVCVLGVSIGKHCVVGANSVVTHNIPDYSVAIGSPAFVIKRYNFDTQKWQKTDKYGNFIEQ